jgi:hypothetical protein
MNIATFRGEKTLSTLAKRLLAEPSKGQSKTSQKEMEAALLRLNPHLKQISKLKKGTPILVPAEFRLAPNESVDPFRGIAAPLLQRSEDSLTQLRTMLRERLTQSKKRSDKAKTVERTDFLEGVFAAAPPTKPLPKEQAAAITAQLKALDKVASDLAAFRRK